MGLPSWQVLAELGQQLLAFRYCSTSSMHPCPWWLQVSWPMGLPSWQVLAELGQQLLACCLQTLSFLFLGAASFFLPKISLYFLPSNLASLVHMLTLPMTDLNSSWLTQVRNHLFTLGYWLRKESTITCLYSMTMLQAMEISARVIRSPTRKVLVIRWLLSNCMAHLRVSFALLHASLLN